MYISGHYFFALNLSEEQILALAPDDASRKSGRGLASPGKWVSKGANEQAIWGECQGSGAKPYQTQVDLGNLAFKCSCPSRKFPCKHGLGLLLLRCKHPQQFTAAAAPAWVTEWLDRRAEKEGLNAAKKDKPVDEAAQAKRLQARQQKVGGGIEELRRWIKDIIRNGLLTIPEKGGAYWENMAKRMIDAQAPGLAARVRGLGEVDFFVEGWQTRFLDRLVRLYMILQGYGRLEELPAPLQEDLKSLVGFPFAQEELNAQEGVRDDWFVLARKTTEEEQLTVERNWLYGWRSKRYALVLQFYVRNQVPGVSLSPGTSMDASLVFYPGAYPLRVLVKEIHNTRLAELPPGYAGWSAVAEQEAANASIYPFADEYPYVVNALKPVFYNNEWWLQDEENRLAAVVRNYSAIWKLLAFSGGSALPMSVIGRENEFEPLGIWYNQEYKIL